MTDFIPTICGSNALFIPKGCDIPHFTGLTDVTVLQGNDFNPRMNVFAYDADGNSIPYTVSPEEIDECLVGQQIITYTAENIQEERIITVQGIDDPTITGLTTIHVLPNEEFDPLTGVSAKDGNGNTIEVTMQTAPFAGIDDATINQGESFDLTAGVKAVDASGNIIPFTVSPTEVDECETGQQVFTYTSAYGSATRTVTVQATGNPTISGASEGLEVNAGTEFDPMTGVSAVDGNGNTLTVSVELIQGE